MADDEFNDETPGYVAPKKVGLEEMVNKDQDDEALNRWKEALLSQSGGGKNPDDPRLVVPLKFEVMVDGRDPIEIDLTKGSDFKDKPIVMKEGCSYRLKTHYKVQNDVVSGLKLVVVASKKGIKVNKEKYMMGSFGPREAAYDHTTPSETLPSGMLARGKLTIKGKLLDDDKNEHYAFEWKMDIKKDWA